jgi:hypothetical protein
MSRSLNRIRNLVSEIEQIQKKGQLGEMPSLTQCASPVDPRSDTRREAAELASAEVIPIRTESAVEPGRVSVKLAGAVVLDLQIEDSSERVELRRVGDAIEIRFSDGKAVHIPFRAVA